MPLRLGDFAVHQAVQPGIQVRWRQFAVGGWIGKLKRLVINIRVKFVAHLIGRQAFVGFSGRFGISAGQGGARVSGAGSRSEAKSAKVRVIDSGFRVDDRVTDEFRAYLEERKIRFTDQELVEHREEIGREIEEEVLRQLFGEAAARQRTVTWDPQVQKALEVMPKAKILIEDPQRFIAEREREARVASLQAETR